ncbi:hypothetical protein FRC11_014561 [Ceratobasidium sp. 423]|nr:hypothetical protein FRC11_014561 [Ceratobasidium sp. 423]
MFAGSQYTGTRGAQGWNTGGENTNNVGAKPFDSIWEKESRIMIGIDIGSTQSGVAIAFLQKGVKQTIHRVSQWPGQALEHQSKIPTLVWYDKDGKPVSVGAETITQQARDSAENNDWTLAKRFKLHLHPSEMREKYSIKLEPLPNGVTLPQIYADFMSYLLKHTEPFFKARIVDGPAIWDTYRDTATFVIGHPNGWGIREQEFLRKATIDSGLVGAADAKGRVRFVTEAEASTGSTFAVCDAGGSTVDTTVYTVTAMNPLLKLAEKRDSACVQAGGLYVDDAVERYLEDVLTRAGIDAEDVKEYVQEGVSDFEGTPKRLYTDGSEDLKLKLGDRGLSKTDINHILLVGGFGDSPYLQQQLRERYNPLGSPLSTVNDSTSKAVAEGAIMWNTMTSVFSRAPNWSYGIQGYVRFDSYSSDHRERSTFTTPDGYEKVTGVWCEIVKKGVPLNFDHVCRQLFFRTYSTPHPNLESIEIALYSYSGNDQPKWLRSKGGAFIGSALEDPLSHA